MSKPPVRPSSRRISFEEQNENIIKDVVAAAREYNADFSGTRVVTAGVAKEIATRSLKSNADEPYSVRHYRAINELSSYTALLQRNRISGNALDYVDLLPIAHPRSTRDHELSGAQLFEYRSRWVLDDPRITDYTVRTLLASALTAHPATTEYEYAIARLEAMPQGTVPQYALVAALGDGNSSMARRARAMLQRRDRKGRFAEMGGGLRALIRMANKAVRTLTGRTLVQGIAGDTFDMELPDGKIVRLPAKSVEGIKALIPSKQTKDGFSKSPASYKTGDPIIDLADLEFVDAPEGFNVDPDWSPDEGDLETYGTNLSHGTMYTDDAYDVLKFDFPNAKSRDLFEIAQQKEEEGQNIVTIGKNKNNWLDPDLPVYFVSRRDGKDKTFAATQSWADALDFIRQDEPKYETGDMVDPKKTSSGKAPKVKATLPEGEPDAEVEAPEADAEAPTELPSVPEGFYEVETELPYIPEGPADGQQSPDFTDDPAELAQKYDANELKEAIKEAVEGTPDDPGTGFGFLPFEEGDEGVPADALYSALKEQGEDAEAFLRDLYDSADGGDAQAPEGVEVPEVSDEVKEELGGDLEPALEKLPEPKEAPPLIEGLTEDEKAEFLETGDYKPYLPENPGLVEEDVPEGYTALSSDPFDVESAVLPEGAPEGFSMNPVDIANNYETEGLKNEFRRALEPGNEMPGYGILGMETPEGEEYVGYVPGEAIRDALQLQGVDTATLANDIYNEGEEGQADDALTPDEVDEALEGEGETPATEPEGEPGPEEAPEEGAPAEGEAEAPAIQSPPPGGPKAPDEYKTGEPDGPAKLRANTTDLKPGDVTANDFFTVEDVEPSEFPGKSWVTGYYPGHQTQKTKLWKNNTGIDVYRNVTPPEKGDLPELSKPFAKDYGKVKPSPDGYEYGSYQPVDPEAKEKYEADWDEYNQSMETAKGMWSPPEDVEDWQTEAAAPDYTINNSIGVNKTPSVKLQPGDITFKRLRDGYEFFVVEGVSIDEDGNAVVDGYYPGHTKQQKSWGGKTRISFIRGAEAPASGDLPELQRPSEGDPDYDEKKKAFDDAKEASAQNYEPPVDLTEADIRLGNIMPVQPSFVGEGLKKLIADADGDPKKFKELLDQEEVFHIDFESTGGFESPSPIQVAIIKTQNGEVVDQLALFMNPEQPLDSWNQDKAPEDKLKDSNGDPISDEFLAEQMSQEDAFKQIFDFMGDSPIVAAHNMPFDGPILKAYANKFGMDYTPSGEIDTLGLSRAVMGGFRGHKLEEVAAKFDLAGPDTDWHDASVDVAVLPGILDALMDQMVTTGRGKDHLDIDATIDKSNEQTAIYLDKKAKGKKKSDELIMIQTFKKGMAGDKDLPSVEEMVDKLETDKPLAEEVGPANTPPASELSDGDFEVESVLGGFISNNWVEDDDNTTNVGKVAVEDMQVGDFVAAKFSGFHEILAIEEDPDDPKKMRLKTRLLATGKEYDKSWVRYPAYEVRRRNDAPDAAPEVQPEEAVDVIDEAPEKEESAGKWQGYSVAQGTDGVYYAEGISGADVQKLRNGELNPPNLPFFAPLGGGDNQETGEGYYFDTKGNRHWGKYGAAGALVRRMNSDGQYEYLLAKRSKGLSQGGGKWAYPGGAHKDQDMAKTIGATAKEEFAEEVGGDITALEPVAIHPFSPAPDWSYDTYIFEVGAGQLGEVGIKDGENSEIGWFTADQMQQMADEDKLIPEFAESLSAMLVFGDDDTTGPSKPTPDVDGADPGEVSNFFDTTDWVKSGEQAGSNEGAFYTDPKTGDMYYVKKPKSEKHAANEVLASALYEEAGTKVGRVFLGKDKKGNTVLVSPIVPGSKKDFPNRKNDDVVKKNAQADFAVDAWLNNYDAVGLEYDNMLTVDDEVWRVDPGGSLIFRAQGKDKDLPDTVTELDSMRDPSKNAQAADIFGDMTDEEIAESAKKVQAISPEKIDELVDAAFADDPETGDFIKEQLKKRRQDLIDRFNLGEKEEEETEVQTVSSSGSVVALDPAGDVEAQVASAISNGQKLSFSYKGKDRIVTPVKTKDGGPSIWTNPKNGNVNLNAIDSDGTQKNFTISKIEPNSDGFEAPVADAPETDAPETEAPEAPTPEPEAPATEEVVEPDADPQPAEKPTEVPQAEKQKILDDLSNLAESVFGKAPDKEQLKTLLGNLKEQGGNPDLIDSAIESLDAPEVVEPQTPEEKIAEDIAQELVPEDPGLGSPEPLTEADIEKTLTDLDLTNPELIWKKVEEDYEGTVLDNGHIVVDSNMHGTTRYDVVVRRTSKNKFAVYHRLTENDGSSKTYVLKGRYHSAVALNNAISKQILNSKTKPNYLKKQSKSETDETLLPTSVSSVPSTSEAHVAADGTLLTEGMTVKVVNPKHKYFGETAVIKQKLVYFKSGKYEYTDYLKVKYSSGEANKINSQSVVPVDSDWEWGDPVPETGETPSATTPTTAPTPMAEQPNAPTPDLEDSSVDIEGPDDVQSKALSDVLDNLAIDKNSKEYFERYGATEKTEYKTLTKKHMVKDGTSTGYNMLPGMVITNGDPDGADPELNSHGIVTKTYPSSDEVDVTFFDGPLAGQSKKLGAKSVYSREKSVSRKTSKEQLGIDYDATPVDDALKQIEADKAQKQLEQEVADLKAKENVNGPGFEVEEPEGPPNWDLSPYENVPSLTAALKKATSDTPNVAANGASVLTDNGAIEDLEMRVTQVTVDGEKKLQVSFKLTDWAGNILAKKYKGTGTPTLEMPQYETQEDGTVEKVGMWSSSNIDYYGKGTTYSGEAGKGVFNFLRGNKSEKSPNFFKMGGSNNGPVSLHNRLTIDMPLDSSAEDIAEALESLEVIKSVRPATEADIRGLKENKMLSIFGRNTDGTKNYAGELRKKYLEEVENKWGFTADDMELVVDEFSRGKFMYLIPESVANKLASDTGTKAFVHNWYSGNLSSSAQKRADMIFKLLTTEGGGLYSTTARWTEGINTSGMSSTADLAGAGADYIFTSKTSNVKKGSSTSSAFLKFYFPAEKLMRRLDFYSNTSDQYGELSEDKDYIKMFYQNLHEVLYKKNLSWADLATIDMDSETRKILLEKLTQAGITELHGNKVEDLIGKAD